MKKYMLFLLAVFAMVATAYSQDASDFVGSDRGFILSDNENLNPLYQWGLWVQGQLNDPIGTGKIWYVDSGVSSELDGSTPAKAYSTINEAIAASKADGGASRGDRIYVLQGHADAVSSAATSIDMDVAGLSIIGIGNGTLQPTVTITHADGTFDCNAPNCRISNIRIVSNVADVKVGLTLGKLADGTVVDNCVFRDSAAAKEFLVCISVAAAANNVKLLGNDFRTTAAAGTNNAILSAAVTGLEVCGNKVFGKYATGAMLTSGVLTQATIADNLFVNAEAAIAIALNGTTSTGVLARNFLGGTTSIAAALTGNDAMWCFENYISGAANASGKLDPAADSDG